MSMEQFVVSNPYVRQLQAEGDCLGMREYILEMVRDEEVHEEGRRAKVLFDEDVERALLERSVSPFDEAGGKTPASESAAPPGPGDPTQASNALPVIDMKKFTLAEYVLDFGNVVKGQQLQKEFHVTNVGFSQVSFEFPKPLKAAMAGAGFIVEPDRVQRLPGSPDFESAEFTVLFNSSRPGVTLGPIDLLLPLQMRSGPQVRVYLKANVTMPDVELSAEVLKFGTVYVGHMRSISVQLSNAKEIPALWSFGQAMASEGGAPKATDDFTVLPAKGTLNPGETCIVQVMFHPRVAKSYSVKVPLRVSQNATKRILKIQAASDALKIRFDPPLLDMSPILPFVQETERRVSMHNDTDVRLEVFSLDFDQRYFEEEEILRRVDAIYLPQMLGYQDVALLPLRQPDQPLQDDVLKAWGPIHAADIAYAEEQAVQADREAARAAAEAAGEDQVEGAQQDVGEIAEGESDPVQQETAVGDQGVGKLQPLEPDLPQLNVLIHAHPLAGGARLAQAIARRYLIGIVNVQKVVDDLMKEVRGPALSPTFLAFARIRPPRLASF